MIFWNGYPEVGKVKFQVSRESDDEGSGSFVFTEENKEEYQNGEMEENE